MAYKAGATIKAGIVTPTAAINPLTVADPGGADMLAQTGEYLCLADQQLTLYPVLWASPPPKPHASPPSAAGWPSRSPGSARDLPAGHQLLDARPQGARNTGHHR